MKILRANIDYQPLPWQRQVHERPERFRVLAVHRQAGKSRGGVQELLYDAVNAPLDTQSPWSGLYCAPFKNQARANVWRLLHNICAPLVQTGICELHEQDMTVRFPQNRAVLRCDGADNPEGLRGPGYNRLVMDEVADVAPAVWEEVLQPTLSRRLGKALFIGTPNGINLFSELYFKAQSQPDWYAGRFTVYDTGVIPPEEIARLEREMTPNAFAREYLCDFSASASDQLLSLTDIELAARRQYTQRDIETAPKILGVDPARFGDDRSVIVRRQGLVMFPPIVLRDVDNMTLAGRVANEIMEWNPDAVFVDSGAGSGVIDRLRQLNFQVSEVPFGGRAIRNNYYVNRRTEMWFAMREWVKSGGSIPNDATLKQELATPKYWHDAQGRQVLESKDEIKKRLQGGASPDLADAACLTWAMPVKKGDRLNSARERLRAEVGSFVQEPRYDNPLDWADRERRMQTD